MNECRTCEVEVDVKSLVTSRENETELERSVSFSPSVIKVIAVDYTVTVAVLDLVHTWKEVVHTCCSVVENRV